MTTPQSSDELIRQITDEMAEAMDVDMHAQFIWGKHAKDCTPHELSEAKRLRAAPFGGGFAPRPDPGDGR